MAGVTINDLSALTTPASNDYLPIWDSNAGTGEEPTKKMAIGDFVVVKYRDSYYLGEFADSTAGYKSLGEAAVAAFNNGYIFTNALITGVDNCSVITSKSNNNGAFKIIVYLYSKIVVISYNNGASAFVGTVNLTVS